MTASTPKTPITTDTPAGRPAVPATQQARAGREPRPKPSPADFGPIQVLRHTGLTEWQWDAGTKAGLIPPADVDGTRWSRAVADDVAMRRAEIVAAVGTDAPVGGHRAAGRLAARTGLAVERPDIEALADEFRPVAQRLLNQLREIRRRRRGHGHCGGGEG